jgi:POT family proton-dependent oligopeptide transporter
VSTKLAPKSFRTQMVALFFLSVALGTAISGQLASLYSTKTEGVYFGVIGGVAIVLGLALAAISPWVRRMMSGVH